MPFPAKTAHLHFSVLLIGSAALAVQLHRRRSDTHIDKATAGLTKRTVFSREGWILPSTRARIRDHKTMRLAAKLHRLSTPLSNLTRASVLHWVQESTNSRHEHPSLSAHLAIP